MANMSVKEAATKFGLSERRVQKLCELNRIDGAERISGVWIIPSDAEKPSDDRVSSIAELDNMLSLAEVCSQLSVSLATGRNWVKLGKLIPSGMKGRSPYFERGYVTTLKSSIETGENKALKSRRNKKFVSGRGLYNSYVSDNCGGIESVEEVLSQIAAERIIVDEDFLGLIVASAAIQMISERLYGQTYFLKDYLDNRDAIGPYSILVDSLIKDYQFAKDNCKMHEKLFEISFRWDGNEDVLGLLYISCLNVADRKASGAYYTPTFVVKKLIGRLGIETIAHPLKVLDPCCGTGNFLLQLPSSIAVDNIFGNDIDMYSVIVARINIALKYRLKDLQIVIDNITNKDYLIEYTDSGFDYVIGNPPWGYEYTEQDGVVLNFKYSSARGSKTESYDVCTEHALETVSKNGVVAFVLPEAILNVKSHVAIRKLITENASIQSLDYLGNVFDGVQCPCIILQLSVTHERLSTIGMTVSNEGSAFTIHQERSVTPEYFSFTMDDEEYGILAKIEQVSPVEYLEGQATFALGIVTGNNKEYISQTKTAQNEMVLKGSDLLKYRFLPTQNYITFKPETFQQVAPVDYYRSPEKLLYRFICNQLVFAYDNEKTLSLNSCNILIPSIPGLSIKYIMAVLNSRISQYYFKKKFNSVKILRSHIEQIPIAVPSEKERNEIVSLVDELLASEQDNEIVSIYDAIDKKISAIYGMTEIEYAKISAFVNAENLFLIQ